VSTFTGDAGDPSTPAINLGYLLLDGTTGKAAGICSPINLISSLAFENVNLSGMNTALLTLTHGSTPAPPTTTLSTSRLRPGVSATRSTVAHSRRFP
jgi:hypothetical protein